MPLTQFILFTMFVMGLLGLTFYQKHLLSVLLCLEGMMLSLFMALSLWLAKTEAIAYATPPMILIAFSACGAGTGLALLIATFRTHNTDHLQNFNLLQC